VQEKMHVLSKRARSLISAAKRTNLYKVRSWPVHTPTRLNCSVGIWIGYKVRIEVQKRNEMKAFYFNSFMSRDPYAPLQKRPLW